MAIVELRVTDLAVLAAARLEPPEGLCVLTGETGSGKSLCVTALRLAAGARADGDLVRQGCDTAQVAVVFDEVPSATRALLEAHGIPDDDLLTLSREISRAGRGVCRVNGALTSVATLRAVGETLVEVTAQGESHRLLRPGRQRELLDAFGGAEIAAARARMGAAYAGWRAAAAELAAAEAGAAAGGAALEEARDLVAELEPLRLRPGENDEVAAELRRLHHAVALRAAASGIRHAAAGADDGVAAAEALATAVAAAERLRGLDDAVDALATACAEEIERLRDLAARAREVVGTLDVDEARLAEAEARLDLLDRVCRRHGSLERALDLLERARERVAAAVDSDGLPARLRRVATARRAEAAAAAGDLTACRRAVAARLQAAVTAQLRELRLPRARFSVALDSVPEATGLEVAGRHLACGPDGVDSVEMRLATSASAEPIALGDGVSGGELSRVALALRSVVARADDCPTLVLDEVDTGLGGETASRVGALLAAIGEHRQVVAVTHRAEIAARAHGHLVVTRSDDAGLARASVERVEGPARELEVARLMSGRVTDAALRRAAELLDDGEASAHPASARA